MTDPHDAPHRINPHRNPHQRAVSDADLYVVISRAFSPEAEKTAERALFEAALRRLHGDTLGQIIVVLRTSVHGDVVEQVSEPAYVHRSDDRAVGSRLRVVHRLYWKPKAILSAGAHDVLACPRHLIGTVTLGVERLCTADMLTYYFRYDATTPGAFTSDAQFVSHLQENARAIMLTAAEALAAATRDAMLRQGIRDLDQQLLQEWNPAENPLRVSI